VGNCCILIREAASTYGGVGVRITAAAATAAAAFAAAAAAAARIISCKGSIIIMFLFA
jgi:hypothetical protein